MLGRVSQCQCGDKEKVLGAFSKYFVFIWGSMYKLRNPSNWQFWARIQNRGHVIVITRSCCVRPHSIKPAHHCQAPPPASTVTLFLVVCRGRDPRGQHSYKHVFFPQVAKDVQKTLISDWHSKDTANMAYFVWKFDSLFTPAAWWPPATSVKTRHLSASRGNI